ncbi:PucR family transcriptional regulator [Rhodococcus wratislaviensis]|uniref:Putative CdaR family transcriptional regulator n=1 Tax=Rhodococcus wratislaviensis NBRC 100605 TaxID=1219028 RepID=X0RC76_RHOWR|nr:helix-turn-helix domain-containing protein [Rhodococcus wratislaviensis]GAF48620.1 putative CdaR family transcriptional regulator [Rhodococcus wratislaviensis NBRC 100605]
MASHDERAALLVARIAGSLNQRLVTLTADITDVLYSEIPDLRADRQLFDLLGASVEGNLDTIFHTLQHNIAPENLEAPAAAMEYARRLAQQGVPVNALVRAYRLGQTNLLELVFDELGGEAVEPELGVPVLERIITVMSVYIDRVSQQVVEVYERERERWLAHQSSVRAVRVQEILAGNEHPDAGASAALNYVLHQNHLAAIIWVTDTGSGDMLARIESAAHDFSGFMGAATDPLFVAADRVTGWVWVPLGTRSAPRRGYGELREFLEARHPGLVMAVGGVTNGPEGFRQSYTRAQRARALAIAAGKNAPVVTAYDDPGVSTVALLIEDLAATRTWVRSVLRGLAVDNENAARLRETVQVYLASNLSNVAASKKLDLHYNSVKYRVKRAAEERGEDFTGDRLAVELALLVCQWLGPVVLTPDQAKGEPTVKGGGGR